MNIDIIVLKIADGTELTAYELRAKLNERIKKQFEGEKFRTKRTDEGLTICFKEPTTLERVTPFFTAIAEENLFIPYLEWRPTKKGKVMRDVLRLDISDEHWSVGD